MEDKYRSLTFRPALSLFKTNGEHLGGPFSIKGVDRTTIPTPVSRPRLIGFLYDYVHSLGIEISYGKRVIQYYEVLDINKAGVVTDKGEHIEADIIIAADGVGSKSWSLVTGNNEKPRSSGFSTYRVAYPTKRLYDSQVLSKEFALEEDGDDICRVYLGSNKHGIVLVSPEITTWIYQHLVSNPYRELAPMCSDMLRTMEMHLNLGHASLILKMLYVD